jgi:hypothetical protein
LFEEVRKSAAAGVEVAWLNGYHLVQADLAAVYLREELDGDGDFESARHGETVGFMERDVTIGLDVDRGQADFAIGDFRQAGDFVLEAVVG